MNPNRITIHCTDSAHGSVEGIRNWHINGNGWSDIGYHYVIGNGDGMADGKVEAGRSPLVQGAHVRGENDDNLGICLVGKPGRFTPKQLANLLGLLTRLCIFYDIPSGAVFGHFEFDAKKTCPGLNMQELRGTLRILLAYVKENSYDQS